MKGKPGSGEIRDASPYEPRKESWRSGCNCCGKKFNKYLRFHSTDINYIDRMICASCVTKEGSDGIHLTTISETNGFIQAIERYYKMKIERLERKLVARSIKIGELRTTMKGIYKNHLYCTTKNLNEGK